MINGEEYNYDTGNFFDDVGIAQNGTFGILNSFWSDITGMTEQKRSQKWQKYMLDYENEYNLPVNQMERLKAAGISPITAAAGIAGSGSTSASPAASPSAGSSGAAGLSSLAGAVTGGIGTAADAALKTAEANQITELLEYNKANLFAETTKKFEEAGLAHWNAAAVAVTLPYADANAKADLFIKLANYNNLRAEYKNLRQDFHNKVAEHEEILSRTKLNGSLAEQAEAEANLASVKEGWQKIENDFFTANGYKTDASNDIALRGAIVSDTGDADKIGDVIEKSSHRAAKGVLSSQKELERYKAVLHGAVQQLVDNNRIAKENAAEFERMYYDTFLDLSKEWQGTSKSFYDFTERIVMRVANLLSFNAGYGSNNTSTFVPKYQPSSNQ